MLLDGHLVIELIFDGIRVSVGTCDGPSIYIQGCEMLNNTKTVRGMKITMIIIINSKTWQQKIGSIRHHPSIRYDKALVVCEIAFQPLVMHEILCNWRINLIIHQMIMDYFIWWLQFRSIIQLFRSTAFNDLIRIRLLKRMKKIICRNVEYWIRSKRTQDCWMEIDI